MSSACPSHVLHIPVDGTVSCRLCAVVKPLPLYDNGTLKRGDKGDYIYSKRSDAFSICRPICLS